MFLITRKRYVYLLCQLHSNGNIKRVIGVYGKRKKAQSEFERLNRLHEDCWYYMFIEEIL
jgi:hypothetical protein